MKKEQIRARTVPFIVSAWLASKNKVLCLVLMLVRDAGQLIEEAKKVRFRTMPIECGQSGMCSTAIWDMIFLCFWGLSKKSHNLITRLEDPMEKSVFSCSKLGQKRL